MDPFKQNKKKKSQVVSDNAIEQVKGLASDIGRSATEDLVVGVAKNVVEQVFGTSAKTTHVPASIESVKKQEQEIRKDERQRYELFKRQTEAQVFNYRDVEVAREIQAIHFEIERIISTSKEVEMSVRQVTTQSLPEKPGEYHLNFFQWILRLVKEARMKVEESATWLSLFISKKKQRNYWAMFKKHGTQFALSNERVITTQIG